MQKDLFHLRRVLRESLIEVSLMGGSIQDGRVDSGLDEVRPAS